MSSSELNPGIDIFKRFYPLSYFGEEEISNIASKARLNQMAKAEVLFKAGSNDSYVIYLIRGQVKLSAATGEEFLLDAKSDQAKYPVANLKPRRFTATVASEDALLAFIPVEIIEGFLAESKSKARVEENVINTEDEDDKILDSDWMMALLQTPMFSKMPTDQIKQLFKTMEEVEVKAGDEIIREGGFGGYYFLIKKGECLVSKNQYGKEVVLNKLYPTQAFGEEALLLNSKRSATVKMATDGVLMRISNNNFAKFLGKHLIKWIDVANAKNIVSKGAEILDLTENTDPKIDLGKAIKISPSSFRDELDKLSKKGGYVIIADSDKNGALASYLMSAHGLRGFVLKTER